MFLHLRRALRGSRLLPRDVDLPGCRPPLSLFPQLLLQIKPGGEDEHPTARSAADHSSSWHSRFRPDVTCASSDALPPPAGSQFCLRSPAWRAGWPLTPGPAPSQPACIWFGAGVALTYMSDKMNTWHTHKKKKELERKRRTNKKERSVKVAETLAKEGEAGGVRWRFY